MRGLLQYEQINIDYYLDKLKNNKFKRLVMLLNTKKASKMMKPYCINILNN